MMMGFTGASGVGGPRGVGGPQRSSGGDKGTFKGRVVELGTKALNGFKELARTVMSPTGKLLGNRKSGRVSSEVRAQQKAQKEKIQSYFADLAQVRSLLKGGKISPEAAQQFTKRPMGEAFLEFRRALDAYKKNPDKEGAKEAVTQATNKMLDLQRQWAQEVEAFVAEKPKSREHFQEAFNRLEILPNP